MSVRRARELSVPIEALNLYAQIEGLKGLDAGTPEREREFASRLAAALGESLANERRVYGRWVQDLFRAVLISLDHITMIKDEDSGEFYFNPGQPLRLPDFRVVTAAGEHLLIEVKNVGKNIHRAQPLGTDLVRAQQRYAQITGARLLYAHYWAPTNTWSLIDSTRLTPRDGRFEITMSDAMRANELGLLGDKVFMTSSTLSLTLEAAASDDEPTADPDILSLPLTFQPRSAVFAADGVPITDPDEHELAKAVFLFGGVTLTEITELREEDGQVRGWILTAGAPPGADTPNVGSWLSKIYMGRYIRETMDPVSGSVTRLRHDPDPTLTRLVAAAATARTDRVMPIEVFTQHPYDAASRPEPPSLADEPSRE